MQFPPFYCSVYNTIVPNLKCVQILKDPCITEKLTIAPRREKFERALNKTLGDIPIMLCEAAVSLDGSMQPANMPGPEDLRDEDFSSLSRNTKAESR